MTDSSSLGIFVAAAVALLLLPGPAVLYIVARGVDQGRVAAMVSVCGIHMGTLAHVLAVSVGLSAVLVASAAAFTAIKVAGGAYLIWLGVGRLRSRGDASISSHVRQRQSLARVFWQGAVVNLLNPKTAIFFLAFLPQFVVDDGYPVFWQLLLLGLLFLVLGFATDTLYALASGWIGSLLQRRPRVSERSRWFTGASYIALGLGTLATGND